MPTILPGSDLETIGQGTQGWIAFHDDNIVKLDAKLAKVMKGNAKVLGIGTVANNGGSSSATAGLTSLTLTDNTTGTPAVVIPDAGVAYSQSTINDINASLVKEINALRADNAAQKIVIDGLVTHSNGITTTVNALLAELRISSGNGVLGG